MAARQAAPRWVTAAAAAFSATAPAGRGGVVGEAGRFGGAGGEGNYPTYAGWESLFRCCLAGELEDASLGRVAEARRRLGHGCMCG